MRVLFKLLLVFVLIFGINAAVSAQQPNDKLALKYYEKGLKAYNKKNYLLADSLLSKSVSIESNKTTFTYLAMTKLGLGDSCNYCKNLNNALMAGEKEAIQPYGKNCKDTIPIIYDCKKGDTIYFCDAVKILCEDNYEYLFYKKNLISNKIVSFDIDVTNFKKNELFDPKFRIDEVPKEYTLTECEIMPEFPGGVNGMMAFISQNLRYPESCYVNKISGKIFISFIVN